MNRLEVEPSAENSKENSGNLHNLRRHQFKPGQSGNPGGRPKKLPVTDRLLELLDRPIPAEMRQTLPAGFTDLYGGGASLAELLAFKLISMAIRGNLKAVMTVLDRTEGKVSQGVESSGTKEPEVVFRLIGSDSV